MNISIQNQQGLDAKLNIQVQTEDYQEELNTKLEDHRKKMTVPGFRKGKAPLGLVRKMVEKDLKHDIINHLLQHKIQDYLKDNNIKLVLSPLSDYNAEDIDWSKENFEFGYDVGLSPEVKLDIKAMNKLTRYKISVDKEQVDNEINALQRQAGKVEEQQEINKDENTLAYLHFRELDEEGTPLEGGYDDSKMISVKDMPKKLAELLIGKSKGFKENINIRDVFSNEELSKTFAIDANMAKDLGDNFETEVVNVYTLDEAELNQEFFDRYFEPGKVTTPEEFKEEWSKMIAGYLNHQSEDVLVQEMKKALIRDTELELPQGLLRKYLLMSYNVKNESELEDFESKLSEFREEMKWMVIADYVANEQKINIEEDEVIAYTIDMLRGEFSRMGMGELDDNTLRQYGINYLSKDNNYTRSKLALRDGRIFEYLLTQISPKEEEVDSKKFEQLRNKA